VYRHDRPDTWPKVFPKKHDGIQRFTRDHGGPGDAPHFLAAWRLDQLANLAQPLHSSAFLPRTADARLGPPQTDLQSFQQAAHRRATDPDTCSRVENENQ
jgi:hypothetical protein